MWKTTQTSLIDTLDDTERKLLAEAASPKYLDRVGRHARHVRPIINCRFIPLVFSAGGLVSKDTASELQVWRKELGTTKFTRLETRLSMALLKARGRRFDVARPERQEDASDELGGEL